MKLVRADQARTAASCTRSSACSRLPQRLRAKARSWGSSVTNSSWKPSNDDGGFWTVLPLAAVFFVKLLEKAVEAGRKRFFQDRIINLAQALHPPGLPVPSPCRRGLRSGLLSAVSRSIRLRQHGLLSPGLYCKSGRPPEDAIVGIRIYPSIQFTEHPIQAASSRDLRQTVYLWHIRHMMRATGRQGFHRAAEDR